MGGSAELVLVERLQARRPEIEQAVLTRVFSVPNPTEVRDPEYLVGLRLAVSCALDLALAAIDQGDAVLDTVPAELSSQARCAARSGVSLDTVLRRYFAGYTLVCDYLLEEAEGCAPDGSAHIKQLLRSEADVFDRIIIAVTAAYTEEAQQRRQTSEHRQIERIRGLLRGELVEVADLDYELDAWHLAIVARGSGASRALRDLGAALDRRLLGVRPDGETVWAWLGGRRRMPAEEVSERVGVDGQTEVRLAIGEPGRGITGWRLTHQQARAALPVAMYGADPVVTYAGVAVVASALRDEVLAGSLRDLYLVPLEGERDGGAALRQTLCAYFAAGRSVVSAAAALGVSRQTVSSRLQQIEERVGRPLEVCGTDLETALRLRELGELTVPSLEQWRNLD